MKNIAASPEGTARPTGATGGSWTTPGAGYGLPTGEQPDTLVPDVAASAARAGEPDADEMTNVQAQRLHRQWNQTTLAFHAGTTQGAISRIERRVDVPGPPLAARLAAVLGLSVDALLRPVRAPQASEVADRG